MSAIGLGFCVRMSRFWKCVAAVRIDFFHIVEHIKKAEDKKRKSIAKRQVKVVRKISYKRVDLGFL